MVNKIKIRITQNSTEHHRLAFVKELKDLTGYGLKDAKDASDKLHYKFSGQPISIDLTLDGEGTRTREDIKRFSKSLNEKCTGTYTVTGGAEWERESKLLSLGLGTEKDYADFIVSVAMTKGDVEEYLSDIISNLNKEKLEEIFNKLIKEEIK